MGWWRNSQGREISKAQVLLTHHPAGQKACRLDSPSIKLRELAVLTLLYVGLLSHLDYYLAVDIMLAGPLGPIESPQSKGGWKKHWKSHILVSSRYLTRLIYSHCIRDTIP